MASDWAFIHPLGLIVHSGDYKFDHTPVDNWPSDYAKLADFSHEGVLALLSDSTNAERPGWTPSEKVIDEALQKVFREAPDRIIIVSFASLISRMQQVANVAANSAASWPLPAPAWWIMPRWLPNWVIWIFLKGF